MSFTKKHRAILLHCILIAIAFMAGWISNPASSSTFKPSEITEATQSNETPMAPNGSAKLHATIEAIDSASATIRLVEWTEGSDNKEQAAFETGTCTLERIENNECLSNPFFIRKTNKQLTLPISKQATILLNTPDMQGGITAMDKTIWNLKDQPKETPYIITTTHGVITEIRDQYVP